MKKFLTQLTIFTLIFSFVIFYPQKVHASELSGEIEVLIHVNSNEMQKYKKAFEKKYPNITVKYTTYYDYDKEVQKRIDSNDYGDVLFIPSFLGSKRFWNYLEPLGSITELSEKYDFLEKGWKHNDIIYGLPSSAYLTGIIYNTEIFDKAGISKRPTTIEEFKDAMASIKKHTNAIPFYTNCSIDWALYSWSSFPFIEMTGNPSYRYNDFIFNENPFSEGSNHYQVLELLHYLVASGYVENDVNSCDWYQACQMLNKGEIGCMVMGSWAIDQIKNCGPNKDNIAFMPFPNNIDGTQYLTSCIDFSYGISANSKNKDIAKAYIEFMLEESGYALDHENISTYKADPYPKSLTSLENIQIMSEINNYDQNWSHYQTLSKDLNLDNPAEIQRIIHSALNPSSESFNDIMTEWNNRWEKNRTSRMQQLKEKKQISSLLNQRDFQLSPTEQGYIHSTQIIKVGYLRNHAPFSMEVDGQFQGACYEICKEITDKTGLQMSFVGYNNSQELMQALKNQEINVAACTEKQSSYEKQVIYSKEYINYANALIKKGDFSSEINDQSQAAAVTGENDDYWKGVSHINYYRTLASCLNSIDSGKADYTIANFYSANYYMNKNMNKHLSIIPFTTLSSMHFAFNDQCDDTLVAIFNKCIYNTSESTVQLYVQKYMTTDNSAITFKRFIEANPSLSLGIVTSIFVVFLTLISIIFVERYKNEQKRAIEMKRYEILSNLANEYIFDYEYATDTVRFDKKLAKEFSFDEYVSLKNSSNHNTELAQILSQIDVMKQSHEHITFQMYDSDNSPTWYKMFGFPIKDKNGEIIHLIGKFVNAQKEMEEKEIIQAKAENDALTKLYNREGFFKRTSHLSTPFMLAVLDLDNFKSVNDTLGHAGGDEALKLLARKLEYHMGETSILGRYGGDEFVIALPDTSKEAAEEKLQALVNSMNTELIFEGITKHLSISVGAVYCTEKNIPIELLFKHADKELYNRKLAGKNSYHISNWNQNLI